MPTQWNGLTRTLVDGIPVWKSAGGDLFYYDSDLTQPALKIGTVAEGLSADWAGTLEGRLTAYRAAAGPRTRAGAAKKN